MTDHVTITMPVTYGTSAVDEDGEDIKRMCSLCGNGINYAQSPFGFDEPVDEPPTDRVVLSSTFGTVHADCYPKRLHTMETREAWVTIATDIARRPSVHTVAEIRAALTALARIAREAGVA